MYICSRGKVDIDLGCDNDSFALYSEARKAFDAMLDDSVMEVFHVYRERYTGITRQGIEALEMKLLGFTAREIAEHFQTTPNNVNAWISRARSRLKNDQELVGYFPVSCCLLGVLKVNQ